MYKMYKMDKINYLKELHEELEIESIEFLTMDTNFKDLEEWDSMTAMVLIGFVNQNFNKNLNSDEIEKCETLLDIINIKEIKLD
jgi:acyl carrier protein